MIQIAKSSDSDPLSCKEICNRVQMPEGYVLQILRKLRMAGLLNSTRGVQGGYNLARPIDQISVMDVCDALGEQMRWECRTQGGTANPGGGENMTTTQAMNSIASQVRSCLWDLKLSSLL